MAEQIKTISDRNMFEKVFYTFFHNNNKVYLKTKSGDLRITFFGYADGIAAFKIPYVKNMPETCIITTRFKQYTVHGFFKLSGKDEDNMYLFHPVKFQMMSIARKEGRYSFEEAGDSKQVLYVVNLISDFIISNSLALAPKKVDQVKETLKFDLSKQFQHVKIYFINEGMSDARMKYFYENPIPIFIPDLNAPPSSQVEKSFNSFINNIYSKDYYLQNRKNLVSEISVPILYKGKIPYGYIQINGEKVMTEAVVTIIKRMAIIAEELFKKNNIFYVEKDRLLVSDVSYSGMGVVFRDRKYIRSFKENSYIYYDILLPENKKASMLSIVRNIELMENKIIKVGFAIKDVDALSEVYYQEFLESIGLSQ